MQTTHNGLVSQYYIIIYNNIIYLGIHDPYKSSDFYMFWASLIIECPTIIDSRSIKNLESRALRETILPYRCSFFCNFTCLQCQTST